MLDTDLIDAIEACIVVAVHGAYDSRKPPADRRRLASAAVLLCDTLEVIAVTDRETTKGGDQGAVN